MKIRLSIIKQCDENYHIILKTHKNRGMWVEIRIC